LRKPLSFAIVAAAFSIAVPLENHAQSVGEYHLKAAFLFNFAKFVEWPAETFKRPADPILICVLGESEITGPLEEAVKGKLVGERRLVIQRGLVSGSAGCHIVFAGLNGKRRRLAEEMKGSGILTIGEDEAFLAEGGVVALLLVSDRVRMKINLSAAERAGLHISSKLLTLAQVVRK
jgi:hypothetical protein